MSKTQIKMVLGLVMVISAIMFVVAISAKPEKEDFVLIMERYPCHGNCQAYQLTIHSDGTVYYSGYSNVREYDNVVTKITDTQVKQILQEIKNSKIFSENRGCCQIDVVDVAGVSFEITMNGDTAVATYPIHDEVPEELRRMECAIDQVIGSKKWIGRNFLCEGVLSESPLP